MMEDLKIGYLTSNAFSNILQIDINSENKQRAILLSVCGRTTNLPTHQVTLTSTDRSHLEKIFVEIVELMTAHTQPKASIFVPTIQFPHPWSETRRISGTVCGRTEEVVGTVGFEKL